MTTNFEYTEILKVKMVLNTLEIYSISTGDLAQVLPLDLDLILSFK